MLRPTSILVQHKCWDQNIDTTVCMEKGKDDLDVVPVDVVVYHQLLTYFSQDFRLILYSCLQNVWNGMYLILITFNFFNKVWIEFVFSGSLFITFNYRSPELSLHAIFLLLFMSTKIIKTQNELNKEIKFCHRWCFKRKDRILFVNYTCVLNISSLSCACVCCLMSFFLFL